MFWNKIINVVYKIQFIFINIKIRKFLWVKLFKLYLIHIFFNKKMEVIKLINELKEVKKKIKKKNTIMQIN